MRVIPPCPVRVPVCAEGGHHGTEVRGLGLGGARLVARVRYGAAVEGVEEGVCVSRRGGRG